MRKLSIILGVAVLALGTSVSSFGGSVTLETDLLSNLVGGTPVSVTDLYVSDVSNTVVQSDVYSRVYTGPNNLYVYLYQLDNKGIAAEGDHALERMTLAPVWGASAVNGIGYLSALDGTDGFLADGCLPEANAYLTDPTETLAPELSFSFRKWKGYQIDPGEHTRVLYAVSPNTPFIGGQEVEIGVNVIDGLVASGTALGPGTVVPEPTTLALLVAAAGLALVGRIRR